VVPVRFEENAICPDGLLVSAGGVLVSVTVGAVVSTVQDQVAGLEGLPAWSVAWTAKVCPPGVRLL
jgi:hypothetical protein